MLRLYVALLTLLATVLGVLYAGSRATVNTVQASVEPSPAAPQLRIDISSSLNQSQPVTGRLFLIIASDSSREPRLQAGGWRSSAPLFAVDVDQIKPGASAVIDADTPGFPFRSLREIPAGDYYVQAVLNIYTRFPRSDGHTIWAHMDQWEGQKFNRSPGNWISKVQHIHLDPATGYSVKLGLTDVIPPIKTPEDTQWVKRIKIQSDLLTKFWGHPIYLGATVLLPKGYDARPDDRYPVIYIQGHFGEGAPFGFGTEDAEESEAVRLARQSAGIESGYQFYQSWNAEAFPRAIAVTFQHPTPYFDDSYAVNSANTGPYGDAILTELLPYVEEHFRIIRQPYARVLTGGSTGGWESLALQVYHPDFFGGTWSFYPDPVDFRRYGMVNIYDDDNAFSVPRGWIMAERPLERTPEGQVTLSMRQMSQLESVLASKGRSCLQLEIWEAVYGPVGEDGYPRPLWDKQTGRIDHDVARYMKSHGYDLRDYIETNWPAIGSKLAGKIHVYCGDMDDFYLNLAVYLLEDTLKKTANPFYAGSFDYGRPMKGHGWHPMTNAELVRMMIEHIQRHLPPA
jgi:hypothetical protein